MATVWIALATPFVLLALALVMDVVERPIRRMAQGDLEDFLHKANPDEVDTFVREGYARALDRYWRRLRRRRT